MRMADSSAQAKTHTIVEHGQSHLIMKPRSSLDLSLDSGCFLVFSFENVFFLLPIRRVQQISDNAMLESCLLCRKAEEFDGSVYLLLVER